MQNRTEWYSARQMHQLCLINGGKAELSDFMSFYHEEQEDEEATPQDFLSVLQASASSNK